MIPHLCIITPITFHPRFTAARPPFFREVNGQIVQRTDLGDEAISESEALVISTTLQRAAALHDLNNEPHLAAMARVKLREITMAWQLTKEMSA